MYEQPAGRRFGPGLVVALVVLAAVAGVVAYLVVQQVLPDDVAQGPGAGSSSTSSGSTQPPATATSPTSQTSPAGNTQTQPSGPVGTQPADQALSGEACPAATAAAVKIAGRPGALKRVLYVEAAMEGTAGAEAWICQDSDGTLYYQGHNRNAPFTASESPVTILLGTGIKGSVAAAGQGYRAVNPTTGGETQYIVTREVLTVINPSGGRTEYTVTKYSPT